MTGTGEAMMARTISRMDEARPPGVSMRSTTAAARRALASARPCRRYSVVAGPTAPCNCNTTTGADWPGGAEVAWARAGADMKAAMASHSQAIAHSNPAQRLAHGRWRDPECGMAALLETGPHASPGIHGSACARASQGAVGRQQRDQVRHRGLGRGGLRAALEQLLDGVGRAVRRPGFVRHGGVVVEVFAGVGQREPQARVVA